jgi:hypothetical protein
VSCNSCGAPAGAGTLICEFCGMAQQTITDPADEVRAVQELSSAWSRMGRQTAAESGGLFSQAYGKANPAAVAGRARNFWTSAYMPSTAEGLFAAAEQAAMMVADIKFGDMMAPTLNPIMLSRMDNCIEMLEIKVPGDPRLAGLTRLYHKKKAENAGIAKQMGFCFPADTRFLTPTGYRAIGELQRGDEVLSIRPDGTLVTQQISRKINYGPSEVLNITVDGRQLRTTVHHSLRTETDWKLAGSLKAGDILQCVDAAGMTKLAAIASVAHEPQEAVFNLHTTGPHTAVAEGVLTHNFNKLRWLRVRWHQWVIDPWVQADVAPAPTGSTSPA